MKREIIVTKDGSTTIYFPDINETYHSKFGAILESNHVFIDMGFKLFTGKPEISILELGFGTGLNALLTIIESTKNKQTIFYTGVDAYPVTLTEIQQLNFVSELNNQIEQELFDKMHNSNWDEQIKLTDHFYLIKKEQFFQQIDDQNAFDL
ncbi:MAG: SAM-dependent methyltransferase, partial [Flavobacterium sp.]|nr:SAM-dependent methyltransferase [Flavobacterium sp.]